MARLTRDITSLTNSRQYKAGEQFIVSDYISKAEAADGIPFYWGNINGGMNNITVLAEDAELAMSAEQVNSRRVPTRAAIINALVESMGIVDSDDFDIDVAEGNTDAGTIEYSGRTKEGLAFGFTIQLTDLGEIDE
jgi:hypothetical protein